MIAQRQNREQSLLHQINTERIYMLIKLKQYTVNFAHQVRNVLCDHDNEYTWRQTMIKKNLQAKISKFLCSKEYLNSHGLKRLRYNFIYKIFLDTHGAINLPDYEIDALARCFLPDILTYRKAGVFLSSGPAYRSAAGLVTGCEGRLWRKLFFLRRHFMAYLRPLYRGFTGRALLDAPQLRGAGIV